MFGIHGLSVFNNYYTRLTPILVSIRRRYLPTQVTQRFLGLVDCLVGLVAGLDGLPTAIVLGRAAPGVLHHALDIGLVQVGAGCDGDLLFAAGSLVFGRGVQDAVGIQVESDLDLRRAARPRYDMPELANRKAVSACGR
jgi:hypothetical protein